MSRTSATRAWGHELHKLTPEDIADLQRRDEAHIERWGEQPGKRWSVKVCRTGKCRNDATHWTSWRYVTGRAGRVSSQRRMVCDEHAAKFRAKHDLPEPAAEARLCACPPDARPPATGPTCPRCGNAARPPEARP